jgi:hypothetical protein
VARAAEQALELLDGAPISGEHAVEASQHREVAGSACEIVTPDLVDVAGAALGQAEPMSERLDAREVRRRVERQVEEVVASRRGPCVRREAREGGGKHALETQKPPRPRFDDRHEVRGIDLADDVLELVGHAARDRAVYVWCDRRERGRLARNRSRS